MTREQAVSLIRELIQALQGWADSKDDRALDDLIARARGLLHRSSPSWVLYKLDAQIDHILLDEAQDTSAAQWDILTAIADEFAAGAGARAPTRSFFAGRANAFHTPSRTRL